MVYGDLCCPVCKSSLVWHKTVPKCKACDVVYPVVFNTPVMLSTKEENDKMVRFYSERDGREIAKNDDIRFDYIKRDEK